MMEPALTLPLESDDWIVALEPVDDVVLVGTVRGRLFIVTNEFGLLQAVELGREEPAR